MTRQNLFVNVHVTKPRRANTHGRIFPLLFKWYAKLAVSNISNYSTEERLVATVGVYKKTAQVRELISWRHHFSSDTEKHIRAAHRTVHEFLNEAFRGQWIGRGSAASILPVTWPPRGFDLTRRENYMWGITKRKWQCVIVTPTLNYEPPLMIPLPVLTP